MPATATTSENFTAETPIGEIVAAVPDAARILDALRVDFCCGGKNSLADACEQQGLDPGTVLAMIAAADRMPAAAGGEHDLSRSSIEEICDHIVTRHHEPGRAELARIAELAEKVDRVHGKTRPQLIDVHERFDAMRGALESHMEVEEARLFPACRGEGPEIPAAKLDELLAMHESEHSDVGAELAAIRELADDYDEAKALCNTHRVLMHSLRDFEAETHQHVHEENNVLFPRVRAELAAGEREPTPRRSIR